MLGSDPKTDGGVSGDPAARCDRVLCVDDEPAIRLLVQELLAPELVVDTAEDADLGLALLESRGPYAVVLSDLRMPGMNGMSFLGRVRERAPDTVRILFTAYANRATALAAVNSGNVFRLVTKPFSGEELSSAVRAGIEQYRLAVSSRELLERTLKGSIKLLVEVLSIVDPGAFGRALSIKREVKALARELELAGGWELELAAMLSQLGQLGIPQDLRAKWEAGEQLTAEERKVVQDAPELASRLIANIPRLERVSSIVRHHTQDAEGSCAASSGPGREDVPIGARVLGVVTELLRQESRGVPRKTALHDMRTRSGRFDPRILDAAERLVASQGKSAEPLPPAHLPLSAVLVGQVLLENLVAVDGRLLLKAGTEITPALLERVRSFARLHPVREPVVVERRRVA